MINISDEQFICFCCRNPTCESYTFFRGYFLCEYCLDDWLKSEDWRKNEDFEVWCKERKKELEKDASSTEEIKEKRNNGNTRSF